MKLHPELMGEIMPMIKNIEAVRGKDHAAGVLILFQQLQLLMVQTSFAPSLSAEDQKILEILAKSQTMDLYTYVAHTLKISQEELHKDVEPLVNLLSRANGLPETKI